MGDLDSVPIFPEDIIIAVLGVTGVGKSTFISHFTKQKVVIGQGLESCTAEVALYQCSLPKIPRFILVDTPGFDDGTRTDTEILKELAAWLTKSYANKIKLTGIIYLHRILDVRMGGAAMKNLRVFKELCGKDNLGAVVLATTFWTSAGQATEIEALRENQLRTKSEYWGDFVTKGSKIFRQDNGKSSGKAIIQYLVDRRSQVVLQIQQEMVDKNKTLAQTAAGAEVQAEIQVLKQRYEQELRDLRKEMEEALAAKDRQTLIEVQKVKDEVKAKMKKNEDDLEQLKVTREQLWQENEIELRRLQAELAASEERNKTAAEIATLRFKNRILMQQSQCIIL